MEQPARTKRKYRFYSRFFFGFFKNHRQDQKQFMEYTKSQKQRAIPRLIATGLVLQLFSALVPGEVDLFAAYGLTLTAVIANVTLLTSHYCLPSRRTLISHVTWFMIWLQLLASTLRRQGDTYNELLGWAALLQYLTMATLPFNPPTLLFYSHLSGIAYISTQFLNAALFEISLPPDLLNQVRIKYFFL